MDLLVVNGPLLADIHDYYHRLSVKSFRAGKCCCQSEGIWPAVSSRTTLRPISSADHSFHLVFIRVVNIPVSIFLHYPPLVKLTYRLTHCRCRYTSSFALDANSKPKILAKGGNTGSIIYDFFIGRSVARSVKVSIRAVLPTNITSCS